MRRTTRYALIPILLLGACAAARAADRWLVDSAADWQASEKAAEGLAYEGGYATPTGRTSLYRSVTRRFGKKRSARSLRFMPSPVWHNWDVIPSIGPSNLQDAPVLLTLGPSNYWIFGLYGPVGPADFQPREARLDGFDIPLKTTPFPHQFDAPGGLKKKRGGYHAWQSRDMVNWVHHGPVTEGFSRWVTTAEYVDGKAYIYYDYPNDQDPHLYIDEDLTDGLPGKNMGLAFKDPSHGSDCAVIRDLQGVFHVIYEDWSPINARRHSWDSPLAGHATSPDGTGRFTIRDPVVDRRTTPTGEKAEYLHPHWKQHPAWDSNVGVYDVHQPEQDAFGDWAAISIGGQVYLFCDYHPAHGKIRVGWFTAPGLDQPFKQCGEIGQGHPDPDITFAEHKFYLKTQLNHDYVSPGPWVGKVEARAGVDTGNDGRIDTWTDWEEVSETYDYIEGFAKQVQRNRASLDLRALPEGYGFAFEVRTEDVTKNASKPILDSVEMVFAGEPDRPETSYGKEHPAR